MDAAEVRSDAAVPPRPPAGASDMVPVRAGSDPASDRGGPLVPTDLHWHPGLDLPPVGGARFVRWDNAGARRRASATSFGLTGRIVVTVVLVGILAWLVLTENLFLWAGAIAYLFFLVPALRDAWAPAPAVAPTPPSIGRGTAPNSAGASELPPWLGADVAVAPEGADETPAPPR